MAKISEFKRLIKEDFNKDDQDLIDKLAFTVNPALETIAQALNKNLTFEDNINSQIKDIEVTVNGDGRPLVNTSYKSVLRGQTRSIIVMRAENLTSSSTYPDGAPFISFIDNAGQVTIQHVTGLQANNKYRLRILAIG